MLSQTIVSEASLLQEEYRLGPLVETYQTQVTRSGRVFFWSVLSILTLVLGGLISLFVWLFLSLNEPSSFLSPLFMVIALGPSSLFLFAQLGLFFRVIRTSPLWATPIRRKIVVSLYAGGIVYREGRKQQVVTWEQIRSVEQLAIKRWKMPLRYYTLKLQDQTELVLPVVIAHVEELGAAIEREIIKRLLPGLLEDYAAHKPIAFPGLCLNQDGISKSDEMLLWPEVEQVTIGVEKLIIKERGNAKEWLTAPIAQFRNACVLEALLEHIREEKGFVVNNSYKPLW